MASASLVKQVKALSVRLRAVAKLLPKDDPLQPPAGKKNAASFLYEMKVLLSLLEAQQKLGWTIDLERRGGKVVFVRGPAKKASASFFRMAKASQTFQVVQGTQVVDRFGRARAPDISLQKGAATDSPNFGDVLGIWDTKLRGSSDARSDAVISDGEFRSFCKVREWLAPPRPGTADDVLAGWPSAFSVCAVISNGRAPGEPAAIFIADAVSTVQHFVDSNSAIWPTRQEHMTAAGL